jgi:NitT/TauT family transport system permease protein
MQLFKFDENNRTHRILRMGAIVTISLLAFLAVWWIVTILLNNVNFPTPDKVFEALYNLLVYGDRMGGHSLWEYLATSLTTFVEGFFMAMIVAIPLGLLLGYLKPIREFITPWIEVLRPIAPIAWAPIFIISFGSAMGSALVVFVGIVFPLLTNIIFGVQKIDKNWLDASKTLGASQGQIFVKVVLPATVPYILNGMKIGLGIGWMCIVAAEMYKRTGGIGQFLVDAVNNGQMATAFAIIIVIAILGILTTGVAEYVSKVVSRKMGMDA